MNTIIVGALIVSALVVVQKSAGKSANGSIQNGFYGFSQIILSAGEAIASAFRGFVGLN